MTRGRWLLLWWSVVPLALTPIGYAAAGCAATPETAVLDAIGDSIRPESQGKGFRVRDILVDPLLHRAFVHVEQCGHPERPLVLLPFVAAHAAESSPASAPASLAARPLALALPTSTEDLVPSGSLVSVAIGDAHTHLTVRGRLLARAMVGRDVEVELASLLDNPSQPGDPPRHVHGRLISADRVEVEP